MCALQFTETARARIVKAGHTTKSYKGTMVNYLEDHPSGCKWLGSPPFVSHKVRPFGKGPTTRSLGDILTMVINHLLTGMILQVGGGFKYVLLFTPKIGGDEPVLTNIFQMG